MMDTEEMGGFSHFLFASPFPLPPLFSPFLSHLLSTHCGFSSWHFLSPTFLFCLWLGMVQTEPNKGLLSTKMWWASVDALTLKRWGTLLKRVPRQNAGFPLVFLFQWWVSVSNGSTYCFTAPFHPAKNNVWWLINTRHVLVNAGCCLKSANSIGCFGRSPLFWWWKAKRNVAPSKYKLYCLNLSFFYSHNCPPLCQTCKKCTKMCCDIAAKLHH